MTIAGYNTEDEAAEGYCKAVQQAATGTLHVVADARDICAFVHFAFLYKQGNKGDDVLEYSIEFRALEAIQKDDNAIRALLKAAAEQLTTLATNPRALIEGRRGAALIRRRTM
jgi:hypothetical protein